MQSLHLKLARVQLYRMNKCSVTPLLFAHLKQKFLWHLHAFCDETAHFMVLPSALQMEQVPMVELKFVIFVGGGKMFDSRETGKNNFVIIRDA